LTQDPVLGPKKIEDYSSPLYLNPRGYTVYELTCLATDMNGHGVRKLEGVEEGVGDHGGPGCQRY
jgi:hypothetical protein